jgi:hypothetical protein
MKVKAAAPTGIAAANVEVEGTDVAATTLHALLDLDGELHSRLDFSKLDDNKVAYLMVLELLLLDEVGGRLVCCASHESALGGARAARAPAKVSMIDEVTWNTIVDILSVIDDSRTTKNSKTDAIGRIHLILFGDFKQLPPATGRALSNHCHVCTAPPGRSA